MNIIKDPRGVRQFVLNHPVTKADHDAVENFIKRKRMEKAKMEDTQLNGHKKTKKRKTILVH